MKTSIGTDIQKAISLLQQGETVAIPTETVYGLAADGTNEDAVLKIFEAKGRPTSNPLILHFASLEAIQPYVSEFPAELLSLAQIFCPGPLTFILPKSSLVPALITAGQETVAVRIPAHPMTLKLLESLDFPIAAPSANRYGGISPTTASHVHSQLDERIPYILDGEACETGLESTIVGLADQKVIVYRLGGISVEQLTEVLGYVPEVKNELHHGIVTSGMVKYHYATETPLFFLHHEKESFTAQDGFILFSRLENHHLPITRTFFLSEDGDLSEAARNLYAALHEMDQHGFQRVFIEAFPMIGLGKTMNDRLKRATAKFSNE
ncbi:MAG: L-threonylcarbamoyladenylate synthase [Flavobacteriales bacterium]